MWLDLEERKRERNGEYQRKLIVDCFFFFYTASQAILTADSQTCFKGKDVYCMLYLSEVSLRVGPVPVNS